MKKIIITILIIFLLPFSFAKTQKEKHANDYLYSAEYFDYLIECAQKDREEAPEKQKQGAIEIDLGEDEEINILSEDYAPFRLKIEENLNIKPYKDSYKKIDTKTIIPLGAKFSVIHDLSKSRNKYNSNDYKILTGGEFIPNKYINVSSGLETNYRGLDQIPSSKKIYFSPGINLGNKISLKFHNKINVLNYSSDHDISLNVSPFKSKIIDFGLYSGLTRKRNGKVNESINFSTNFYF